MQPQLLEQVCCLAQIAFIHLQGMTCLQLTTTTFTVSEPSANGIEECYMMRVKQCILNTRDDLSSVNNHYIYCL